MTSSRQLLRFGSVCVLAALIGCGGDALILPGEAAPIAIAVVSGDGQADTVSRPLLSPLVVRVTDSKARAVEGQMVTFTTLLNGTNGRLIPDTAFTDADGRVQARWILGTNRGEQTVRVRLQGSASTSRLFVDFNAQAAAEMPSTMILVSGDGQHGMVGTQLDRPLVLKVADRFGNGVGGVVITWTVLGGGGVSTSTTPTDGDGQASVQRTLGPVAGSQGADASAPGLPDSPLAFTHIAAPGQPVALLADSGDGQTALPGQALARPLVVRLVDANGNGVPGAAVAWAAATGAGKVSPASGTLDASGRAATSWTLGPLPGSNTAFASAAGYSVLFSATGSGVTGTPATVTIAVPPSAAVQNAAPFPTQPAIRVQDGSGNLLAGVAVTVTIASGGGVLSGTTTVQTDASGVAAFSDLSLTGLVGVRLLRFAAGSVSAQSAGILVMPGQASAPHSTATVPPTGRRNKPTVITIQTRDQSDNNLTVGGHAVAVNVTGANIAGPVSATDNGDGTYTVSYTPSTRGTDTIAITLDGAAIGGSPYQSSVK